jgi:hypothetical protein
MKRIITLLSFLWFLVIFSTEAQFTPNNLAVVKITNGGTAITDDGAATLTNALLRPVSIMQYATTGAGQTGSTILSINSTGTNPKLTIDQRRLAHEGHLNLSANGQYLVIVGYNSVAGVSATTSPNGRFAEKRVARIDASGNIDLTTSIPTTSAYNNQPVRGAVMNGNTFTVNGGATTTANNGVRNVSFGANAATAFLEKECRAINMTNGNIYSYTGSTIEATGQPTITGLITVNTQFLFFDLDNAVSWGTTGFDVLYVANRDSGINKYYFDGGTSTWVAAGQVNSSIQTSTGFQSLTGRIEGGQPTLYGTKVVITSGAYVSSHLVKVADVAARTATLNFGSTAVELASTGNTEMLKGVAFTPQNPSIAVTPTSLSGFATNLGTPSATQTYSVSGSNLEANISITAPAGFEINTAATGTFQNSLTLTQTLGTVPSTTIHTRLTGASVGSQSGTIIHTSTGATAQNVALTGSVSGSPSITVSNNTLTAFSTTQGTPSSSQTYTVSGSNLTNDIELTAPAGFEISTDGNNFFDTRTLTQTSGAVASTTISVRLKGTSIGTPSGDITHTSTGATTQNKAVSGTVTAAPTITLSINALSGFSTTQGSPSAVQTYSVSGVDLIADIALTAPVGFEISTDGTNFFDTRTLTQSSGTVSATTISVRLKGTTAGSPSGNLTHTTTGGIAQNVALSGTVIPPQAITITGTPLSAFTTTVGTPSATQNYTVSGSNLTADIALTAPTGFEISLSASSGFGNSLNLTQTSGSVSATTIYVRLTGASVGTPSGNITHISTGATAQNVAVSGTVNANVTPTITITGGTLTAFITTQGTASATQNYTVSGTDLSADIAISAPTGFEISLSASSGFGNSLNLTKTSGSVSNTTIYVRLTGTSAGSPSGNITHTSTGAATQNVAVSGTVVPPPSITITGTPLSAFNATQGTPSASQSYSVSGSNLTADIALTAPTGFEISLSASSGFGSSLNLTQTSGTISSTTIYARLTAATVGTPSGNITHTSTGATTQNVAVSGTVVPQPVITITGTPLSAFSTIVGTPSNTQVYSVSGANLTANIALTAPTGFEISLSAGSGFGGSLTLTQTGGSISATDIYVRLTGTSIGTPSGNITHTSTGATAQNVAVNGTVTGVPSITTTGTLTAFSTVQGFRSASQSYAVSGSNLSADIAIAAPTGFEISLSAGGGFGATLSLTPTAGTIASTNIFVRLIGTTTGSASGNITHTSTGATAQNVAATGTVNAPATGFSKNNITVLRVGDGTTALGATATNVDLLELTPTGTPTGYSIALPSTGTTRLVLGGANATYEGQLTLSADNRYLGIVGYNVALGTAQTGTGSMTTSEKVIARIGFDNVVDLTTRIPATGTGSGFGTNTVRNVATDNGSVFIVAGSNNARQINFGTTVSSAIVGSSAWRSVNRFGGRTYGINFQVPQFLNTAVTPNASVDLPSAAGVNVLPNFTGGGSATGIFLLDADPNVSYNSTGYDLLYISEINNGIRKWYWDAASGFWTPAGIVNPTSATGVTGGFYDLTVKIVNGKPEIYGVKGAASNNNIMKLIDNSGRTGNWETSTGGAATTVATLASAGVNYMFRGVAFSPVPLPLITVTPSSLNSFSTFRNTPSTTQTYTVSGINLLSDIILTAPAGYEISLSASSGFANTLTVAQTDGSVATTTIFVRLTGATVGTFNGNITNVTTNGVTQNIALTGVVNEIPSITITGAPLNNFSTVDGTPSATQSYTVSGADLVEDITLTAPSGFEISLNASSGFSNTLTLTRTGGTVATTTIYVRLTGAGVGTPSGNLTHTSSVAPTQNIALTGNVIVNNGILIIETPLATFTTTQATPSPTQIYKVGGTNLTADIVITAPAEYEISLSASNGFGNTITLPQSAGSVALTPIYVRLTGATVGTPNGNIVHTSTGTSTQNVALNGTVLIRPVITVTPTSLTGFVTSEGTPSATQTFTAEGTNLIAPIALTAPTGFEISLSANSGFAGTLSLTPTSGTVSSTTIYVRLTGATISTPSGNIDLTTTGAIAKTVAVSGVVNPKPLITVTGTLTAFSTREQTAAATQTYTVNGVNLVSDITLTAPTGFEISTSASSGFSNALTLTQSGGNVATTTIYARIAATATAGSPSGNIAHTSTDAITKNIAVSGSVSPFREIILAGTPLTAFTTFVGTASTTQSFSVSGINLTNDIILNAPMGYEISLTNNSGFSNTLILTQTGGSVASTSIFVRLTGATIGTPSGNISLTSTDTDLKNVAVTGTVNAIPVITISGTLTAFSTNLGVLGTTQSYTVSGTNLLENIVLTAPAGFVISTSAGGGFTNSLSLTPVNGVINSRIIYVRINEAVVGTPSGNITHTTNGAVTQNVAVSGSVTGNSTATVYYVSPTGDDNNDGTSPSTPFRNLSKFSFNSSPLNPGDVVYLMNGTHGAADLAVGNTGNALVEITKSGTLANPIKFTNYPGHTPLIQFNGWNAILIKASHIIIDGLKVRGANSVLTLEGALNQGRSCNNPTQPFESKYNGNGINVDGRLSVSAVNPVNVTIRNCEVYECGGGGIATLEADYLTIENNITYNNAWYSVFANSGISVFHAFNSDNNTTDYKTIIRNNISYGNEQKVPWPSASCQFTDGNGIIVDDFRNTQTSSTIRGQVYLGKTLVENNIVFNNGGRGVHAYIADNCTFINNTSFNNNATAAINEGEITIVNSNNARVFNNVMVARTGKRLNSYSGSVGLQEGNNLMYNSGTFGFFNSTDIMADPQFVNAAANDFRLLPTSVGIDAGNATQDLFALKDILGKARPFNGRVDIGAYEFTGTLPTQNKFTEGNLVALRVGDGSTTLGVNSANVDVIEYTPAGTASGLTIPLPSTGTNSFVLSGLTNIPEGQLTLSGDGRYLSAVGYNTTVAQSNTANTDKIVVRIDDKLNLDLTTKMPTSNALGGSFVRNAVTENGSSFFVTANATARQVNLGANTSATFAGAAGYFSMLRLGGRSYFLNFQVPGFITDAGVATSLPSGAGVNALPNFTGASEGTVMSLLDSDPLVSYNSTGFDVLYIAEKSSGIRKWYWDTTDNLWKPAGIVNPTGTPAIAGGFYSVVSKMVAGKPELYAIKGVGSNNAVFKIVDNTARTADWQTGTAPTVTTIIPAGNNYTLRGLTFAPVNKPENQLTAAVQGNSLLICSGSDAVFTLTGTSGATVTYNINGGANTTAVLTGGTATVTVSGATANQTLNLVSITNGTITQTISGSYLISVTTPTVGGTISTPSPVCAGTNSTTLTLSGHTGTIIGWERSLDNFATAGTYINFLSTAYTVTNLSATTSYRAIIQSGACATVRSSISTIVVAAPTKPVVQSNTTITSGSNITLTATGCQGSTGTYALKWYNSSDNSSVTMPVSPTVTTSYYAVCEQTINTVTCASVKSDDVTVTVNTGSAIISIKTGDWEDPTTWDAGRVPNANDTVIVDTGHTVSLNGAGSAKNVTQRGVLSMKNGSVLNLGF